MTAYADYEYYKTEYLCGKKAVVNSAFDYYARSASLLINAYTSGNIDESDIPESVKLCCCELAELAYRNEKMSAKSGISSASVGDESVSYASDEECRVAYGKTIRNTIYKYLADTDLLYRGGRR